jgi:two-component system, cell cycle sensor histidine kinase and response regulator CckA
MDGTQPEMVPDERKTREQLLAEIAELRLRVEELETAGRARTRIEREVRAELVQQARDALNLSERKFKDLVQSLNAIVWEADAGSFEFTFVSGQAEAILGYPVEQWLKEPRFWSDHIHPDDREAAVGYCIRSTQALMNHEFEYRMIAKDGRSVWLRDLVTVESSGNIPMILRGVMFDVTERKHLEAQLLQAQKMESMGRLAGGIAHDFNNLLTAIMGYTDLTLLAVPPPGRANENLQQIKQAALRAVDLTRQLLAFARRQVAEPQILDVNELVRDTSKLLRRLIGEDIELVLPAAAGTALIKANAGQIEQVLINLAVNARDAMPRGGTLTIATTQVTLERQHGPLREGKYVCLTVTDTGVGMSDEAKDHMFEPFFTTKEVGKGTGLGLATCYGIITQSGGHIEIDSQSGRGTTVIIYLPVVSGVASQALPQRDAPEISRGHETVLLVEDEPAVRVLSADVLRRQGYTVLEAQNGEDALRLAAAHEGRPIHLLMTDVVMPQMGGESLAASFQSSYPEARVLFTSGYAESESFRARVRSKGAAFIEKPFTPAALARKVREVLDAA